MARDDPSTEHDAYESIAGVSPEMVLTCEHASCRLPEPWTWPERDRRLLGTHWSHDIGAAEIVRSLAERTRSAAVLARFTRLLVDPNRAFNQEGMFREEAEGGPVLLNHGLDEAERERRLSGYYRPYHAAIDRQLAARPQAAIFSVHTFTPVYLGQVRPMEIGLLFDRSEAPAMRLGEALTRAGFRVALNEPYSGKAGFAFSPEHHGEQNARPCLEIEIRQDLATDPLRRDPLIEVLAALVPACLLTPGS